MAEETMDHQLHSPLQAKPITQEVSVDSKLQPAIGTTQEAELDHLTYQQLLEYIEARQQVLSCNIDCCNRMLELLSTLLSIKEPFSTEAEEKCENSDLKNQPRE